MNMMFSLFAKPLGWVMHWIYQLVPSYFLALLIFTFAIRLVLFPLSINNQKSATDRARLAPRLERIQKKYAQDRQKMMQKQMEELEEAWTNFKSGLTAEKMNQPEEGKYYRMSTPLRDNRFPTGKGAGQAIIGEQNAATNASVWSFVQREDGSFDIVNYGDQTYISPASSNNTALTTVKAQPNAGWTLKPADAAGYVIITSGTVQFNQTNGGQQFKLYNWGDGTAPLEVTFDTAKVRYVLIRTDTSRPMGIGEIEVYG